MTRIATLTSGACAVFLLAAAAVPAGQSLAEIARKEAERRKTIKAPTKVYTNSDLNRYPGDAAPPAAPAPAGQAEKPATTGKPAASAPGTPPPAAEDPAKDEKTWRQRILTASTDLDRNKIFLEALQSQVNALTTDYVNRDDPAQRVVIGNGRQRALTEMERVRGEIQRLTAEIASIEDEARKANVPPGWLR